MTISTYCRLALILTALAIAGQLEAQVDLPAPESGAEDQTEEAPSPELPPGPPVQIRPDEGSPVAGTEVFAPQFGIGRHLQLSGSLTGGYDDNVNLTPTGSPASYVNASANVRYLFGSARLAIDLLAAGGISYYIDQPGGRSYDPFVSLDLSLAYKVTPRLTLHFSTSSFYGSQPELGTALSSSQRLGNYVRSANHLSADYRLSPRWSSITSYSLSGLNYGSSAASGSDRLQHVFSEQLHYLWMPTTSVSGDYRVSLNGSQGAQGDSISQSLLAGLQQSFGPRLKAGLHIGVQIRSGNNGDQISPHVETSLQYGLGARTHLIWTGSYSIEESDLQRAAGRETFRTNLALNYVMTARISASLALSYAHGDNQSSNQISSGSVGGSLSETTFDITPSVRYAITQHCSASVGYRYTDVSGGSGVAALNPSQPFRSYTRNRYFAGITLSF